MVIQGEMGCDSTECLTLPPCRTRGMSIASTPETQEVHGLAGGKVTILQAVGQQNGEWTRVASTFSVLDLMMAADFTSTISTFSTMMDFTASGSGRVEEPSKQASYIPSESSSSSAVVMLVLASTSKEQIQRTDGQAVRVTDLWRAQRVHQQALLLQKVLVSESTKGLCSRAVGKCGLTRHTATQPRRRMFNQPQVLASCGVQSGAAVIPPSQLQLLAGARRSRTRRLWRKMGSGGIRAPKVVSNLVVSQIRSR